MINNIKINTMELTEEVLKARAERKTRRDELARAYEARVEAAKAEAKAKNRKLLKQIKVKYPAQFAEFKKLKKLKVKYNTGEYDDQLHWLQMEMIYGREWKWDDLYLNPEGYSKEEKEIISRVASKYYESLENRLWAGENVDTDRDELIRLIEEAGVDTFERDGDLFWETYHCMDQWTRLCDLLLVWTETSIVESQEDFPEELQF